MPDGATPDVRLGDLVHKHSGHYATLNAALLERVLQGDRVDNCGKHAHIVRGHPVHLFGLRRHTAEKIAAADHDPDFDTQGVDISDFSGNVSHFIGVQTE
jgi:hypothetical protein